MEKSKKSKVVIVEDSSDDAHLAMKSFEELKFIREIVWLKDGEEALDYFKGKGAFKERDLSMKPQLILLDLKLPKISGIDVLKELKKDEEFDQVPIVIMTSSKEDKDLDRCYELGANSYVVKPINYEDFKEVNEQISKYWTIINETPEV